MKRKLKNSEERKDKKKKKSRSKRKHNMASAARDANHSFNSLTWCKALPRSTPRNKEMSLQPLCTYICSMKIQRKIVIFIVEQECAIILSNIRLIEIVQEIYLERKVDTSHKEVVSSIFFFSSFLNMKLGVSVD